MDNAALINQLIENGASLETDNYGQIVIYTGLKMKDDGTTEEMTAEDYEMEID